MPIPIRFYDQMEILWSRDVTVDSETQFTGNEGNAIVKLIGVFYSIKFDILEPENYQNIVFGGIVQPGITKHDFCGTLRSHPGDPGVSIR